MFPKPLPPNRRPPTIMRASHIGVLIGVGTFVPKDGGGLTWPVRFELQAPAAEDGYLIQEIHVRPSTLARDEADRVPNYHERQATDQSWERIPASTVHYWEAWPVKVGTKHVDWGNRLTHADDEYEVGGDTATKGIYLIEGFVKHYYGALPDSFRRNSTQAQALPSTTFQPVFWSRHGATPHHVECHWNRARAKYTYTANTATTVLNV